MLYVFTDVYLAVVVGTNAIDAALETVELIDVRA